MLAALGALLAAGLAADRWVPGERVLDGRLRDIACSVGVASGRSCFEAARPRSSAVPWAVAAGALLLLLVVALAPRVRRRVAALSALAVAIGMAAVTTVARSGGTAFDEQLGDHHDPTTTSVLLLVAGVALLAVTAWLSPNVRATRERPAASGVRRTTT